MCVCFFKVELCLVCVCVNKGWEMEEGKERG